MIIFTPMKRFLILPIILPMLACTGASNFIKTNGDLMMAGAIHLILPEIIDKSLHANPGTASDLWHGISDGLKNFAIPLAKGTKPKIEDLESWTDLANLWTTTPLTESELATIQRVTNLILSYIPTDKWAEAKKVGTLSGDVQQTIISGLTIFAQTIDDSLAKHTILSAGAPMKAALPAKHKVIFDQTK